jgi:hypothetical protein
MYGRASDAKLGSTAGIKDALKGIFFGNRLSKRGDDKRKLPRINR